MSEVSVLLVVTKMLNRICLAFSALLKPLLYNNIKDRSVSNSLVIKGGFTFGVPDVCLICQRKAPMDFRHF